MFLKQRSILPGFGLGMSLTLVYLSLIVLIPLAALFLRTTTLSWEQFLDHDYRAARPGVLLAEFLRFFHRCGYQCVFWLVSGVGAGAVSVSRQTARGRTCGPPFCLADRGCRH